MSFAMAYLAENAERLGFDRFEPGAWRALMLTPRFRASSHVIWLVSAAGRPEPRLVIKAPRLAGADAALAREAANLAALAAASAMGGSAAAASPMDGSALSGPPGAPRLLAFEPFRDRSVLVQTALNGRAWDRAMVRRDQALACRAGLDWLLALPAVEAAWSAAPATSAAWASTPVTGAHAANGSHRRNGASSNGKATRVADAAPVAGLAPQGRNGHARPAPTWAAPVPETAAESYERLIEGPLAWLVAALPLGEAEGRLIEGTLRATAPLATGGALPLRFEHGDFSAPNVLRLDGGGLGAVDWEQAEPRGLPACDLFFWLAYLALARGGRSATKAPVAALAAAFDGPDAWAPPYALAYARQLGLSEPLLGSLFVATWARTVVAQVRRLSEAGALADPAAREATLAWLRGSRYMAYWQWAQAGGLAAAWLDARSAGGRPARRMAEPLAARGAAGSGRR